MSKLHLAHWPKKLPRTLSVPETSLSFNLQVTVARYPNKTFILYYDTPITFAEFKLECDDLSGYLHQVCQVQKGDRVLLFMQNCPQFIISYYGILGANAVVVPINPMNLSQELEHFILDSGANTIIISQELLAQLHAILRAKPLLIKHVIVTHYKEYLRHETSLKVPEFLTAHKQPIDIEGAVSWRDALDLKIPPPPSLVGPDDLCVMPYTSGTTGNPKGCMHTHKTVMSTICASAVWFSTTVEDVRLAALPLFHVTGMQGSMNEPLFMGSTIVLLSRWDRDLAAQCIERYKVSAFSSIPTMVVDFLANPKLSQYDISSLNRMNGGGSAMPHAIAQKLLDMGIVFIEGYGLTETMAPSHLNPVGRAKKQCLGMPIFGVESFIADPQTLQEVPNGEIGEILISGPQIFKGYWKATEATAQALVEIRGKTFLRTGDLAREDEDGYFFMVDRLKRMINASGFKVWPSEVELMLYRHPHIQEACVISTKDAYRGESVKALVVLKQEFKEIASPSEIIDWARAQMAAYKVPRSIEFMDSLPKSGTGKILWRQLQEAEHQSKT
jgi:fatty-acyl-CoA synthase